MIRAADASRRRAIAAGLCFVASLLIAGFYLQLALTAPRRLTAIVLAANYLPPIDSNPWTAENRELLGLLNGHNLSVVRGGTGDELSNGDWTEFTENVSQHVSADENAPVVLYINLHSGVDDQGEPCVIPPLARQEDSRTWVPIWEIVKHTSEALVKDGAIVLALECGRLGTNSAVATDNFEFCKALEKVLEERSSGLSHPLHVLVSSSNRLPSFSDWGNQCDPFTRELARGLHGEADHLGMGGNGDHYVDFAELQRFVASEVSQWSLRHRGLAQDVWSWSSSAQFPDLCWQLPGKFVVPARSGAKDSATSQPLVDMWGALASLRAQQPWLDCPAEWKELCLLTLGYEQAIFGGADVQGMAETLRQTIDQKRVRLQERLAAIRAPSSFDKVLGSQQAATWRDFSATPTLAQIRSALQSETQSVPGEMRGVPVLTVLANDPSNRIWQEPELLANYANLRQNALTVLRPEIAQEKLLTQMRDKIQSLELRIDDAILADNPLDGTRSLIEDYEHELDQFQDLHESILNRASALFELVSEVQEIGTVLLASQFQSVEKYNWTEDRLNLSALLARKNVDLLADIQANQNTDNAGSTANILQDLRNAQDQLWLRLLGLRQPAAATDQFQLEQLVSGVWLPAQHAVGGELGAMRWKAREALVQWERRLDEVRSDAALDEVASSHAHSDRSLSEPRRFFASCLTGESNSSSLTAARYRTMIKQNCDPTSPDLVPEERPAQGYLVCEHAIEARLVAAQTGTTEASAILARIRQLATQRCLSDFAEATLDSFWAVPTKAGEPYFAWVARQALDATEQIQALRNEFAQDDARKASSTHKLKYVSVDTSSAATGLSQVATRCEALQTVLERRRASLGTSPATQSTWVPAYNGNSHGVNAAQWEARVSLQQQVPDFVLPSGLASLTLRDDGHLTRQAIAVGDQSTEQTVVLPVDWLAMDQMDLSEGAQLSLDYRGHLFQVPLSPLPSIGNGTSIEVPQEPITTLTIRDDRPATGRITFILDCSASMFAPADSELGKANDDATGRLTKMDAAKLALLRLLKDMRGQDAEVSVVLYGHRVSQGSAEQGRLLQSRYLANYPLSSPLEAFEDVEIILPMGRFGPAEYQAIEQRLASVLPWGQTPLYLAVSEALEATPNTGQQHDLIVISDGRNYQFNPTVEKNIDPQALIAQAKEHATRVHVIGFGVPTDEAEESLEQFQALAHATNGQVTMQVANASLLTDELSKLNARSGYQVRFADTASYVGQVNRPMSFAEVSAGSDYASIFYEGNTYFVAVERGAALQLNVNSQASLVCARLNSESPRFGRLYDARDRSQPLEVGIHQPRKVRTGVRWKLSIQSTEGVVIRRPREVVIEIQPITDALDQPRKAYPKFIVCDPIWAEGYPVPVIEFQTDDWPPDANRAEVMVWASEAPGKVLDKTATEISDRLSWQTQATEQGLSLILALDDEAKSLGYFPRVREHGMMRVERRFSSDGSLSYHRFVTSDSNALQLEQNGGLSDASPRLEFHSLDAIKATSLRLERPIEIELMPDAATLSPTLPQ